MQLCILYIFANLKLPPISYSGCESVRHPLTCLLKVSVRHPITCDVIPQSEWDIPLPASKRVRRPTTCQMRFQLPASKRVRRPTACHFIPQSEWDIPLTASKWVRRPTACITWHLIPQCVRYPSACMICDLVHHDQSEWDTRTFILILPPRTSNWMNIPITCDLIPQSEWDIPLPTILHVYPNECETSHYQPPHTSVSETITCHLVPQWVWDIK
jgi:hypothetical protein